MLIATCPRCRASYQVADHLKGKKIRCRKCQQVFPVRPAAELEEAWEPVDEDERDPARAGKEKASSQANRSGRSRRARGEEEVEERAPGPRKPPRPEAPRKPKEVLRAIFLLVGVGAFETAIPLFLGTVMLTRGDKPTDEFGGMLLAGITVFLLGKGATAFTSAVLLARHRPLGRVLAWVIAILCFPGFPVFTVISLALMSALHSRGMRDYFAADREEEAPVYAPGLPRGEKRSGGLSDQVRPSPRWWVVLGVCAGV
ncbi:MAG: zinc-ribbon domain-containing protein, partial [Planctomycetes bacterium]|nr:zinc-ribbon domain-containing protein [Planctomycetota bacterium]